MDGWQVRVNCKGERVILQARPPALCLGLYVQLRSPHQRVRPISPGAPLGSTLPLNHSANAYQSFPWCQKRCWVLGAGGKGTAGCAGVRVRGCVGAQSIQCRAPRPAPPNRSMMLTEERSEINNGFYLTQYSQNIIVPTCKRSLKNLNEIRYILSFGPSL